MELKILVEELDNMVVNGQMIEAFEKFFHDDCVTHYSHKDKSAGKAEKKSRLVHFFKNIAETNSVVLHSVAVGDNVTMSEMTFEYTFNDGTRLRWNEVLRRIWADDKVIDERYYIGEDTDVATPKVKTIKPRKTVIKKK
jgi:hypothetical protein